MNDSATGENRLQKSVDEPEPTIPTFKDDRVTALERALAESNKVRAEIREELVCARSKAREWENVCLAIPIDCPQSLLQHIALSSPAEMGAYLAETRATIGKMEERISELKRQRDPVSDLPGAELRGRAWAQHLVANQLLDLAIAHWGTNEVIIPEMIRGISDVLREQAKENYETARLQQEKSAPKGKRMIPAEDIEIGMVIAGRKVVNKAVRDNHGESPVVLWIAPGDHYGNHMMYCGRTELIEVEGG